MTEFAPPDVRAYRHQCVWCGAVFIGRWNQKVCQKAACQMSWRREVNRAQKRRAKLRHTPSRVERLRAIGARVPRQQHAQCPECGEPLLFAVNRAGQTIDWCTRCQRERIVPVIGQRRHDQRATLEAEMQARAATAMSFTKQYRGGMVHRGQKVRPQ